MKKFLDLSSWSRWSLSLSKGAAIGSMLIMAFAVVGCDDSSSASAGQNDDPGVESSSSSSDKVIEPAEGSSSSDKTSVSSSSSADELSSSSLVEISSSSEGEGTSSSSGQNIESSSSSASGINCSALLEGRSGWSSNVPKECRFNPYIDYGTMTDERDGKTYRTVKIGDQVWMAENLNYSDSITTPSLKGKNWCYKDYAEDCDVVGRLYTWAAAIDSVALASDEENPLDCGDGKECGLTGPVQGICPNGWHLPSEAEWETLVTAVGSQSTGGKKLKSRTGWGYNFSSWNGTDAFGFSALPAGVRNSDGGFGYQGYNAYFWSSTENYSNYAYDMNLDYSLDVVYLDSSIESRGCSVRCVKD